MDATSNAYTKKDIQGQETRILRVLEFRLGVPTPYTFLTRLLAAAGVEEGSPVAHLATYLAELCAMNYRFLRYIPSAIAAATLNLSMRTILGPGSWGPSVVQASGWSESALRPLTHDIYNHALGSNGPLAPEMPSYGKLMGIFRKYNVPQRDLVAGIAVQAPE